MMKHFFFAMMLVAGFLSLASVTAMAQTRGEVAKEFQGEGTEEAPYLISTAAELRKLADDVEEGMTYRDEYFKLMTNIVINKNVLTEKGELNEEQCENFEQWKPIGTEQTHFCGIFDGNNHSIAGLYMYSEYDEIIKGGLFGYLSGTIKNLIIKDSYFGGNGHFGCFAYHAEMVKYNNVNYKPTITNCLNYGVVALTKKWGAGAGICLSIRNCSISKCVNYGTIKGVTSDVRGGIIGSTGPLTVNSNSIISDCCNMGLVEGNRMCGGIIGQLCNSKIYNCVNHSIINTMDEVTPYAVGGICGQIYKATVDGCVNYGKIQAEGTETGAIVGMAPFSLTDYKSYLLNNAYLETSCAYFVHGANILESGEWRKNNKVMTKREMKQQSFLDELNANVQRLGKTYSKWKFGGDGFPTLAWVADFIAMGIENVKSGEAVNNNNKTLNCVYNLNGQIVRPNTTDTNGLPKGIYIVNGKKIVVT